MAKRPELVIISGALAGRTFEVKDQPLRLGRSSSNDIPIPDEELSRNHCLFEPVGETGLCLTDLASANGTSLNGTLLGKDPVTLKEGDVIEVGSTLLRIGDPPVVSASADASTAVDLGLDASASESSNGAASGGKPRKALANILWIVAVAIALAAIALILLAPKEEVSPTPLTAKDVRPEVREVSYEKVEADLGKIFRYEMSVTPDNVISARIDDVPRENRHHVKRQPLTDETVQELREILAWDRLKNIDSEYAGAEPDPPALKSWRLKVVYTTGVRVILVQNTERPEAFLSICDKLEAFAKSELGNWAIEYPREKLIELAQQAVELGDAKWIDRDVNHGNLAAAISAYREAGFYLETIDPKPPCNAAALEGLRRAKDELDKRYQDQRFRADRALNLKQWEVAQRELQILLEMVPDRRDDRNRDAKSKLLSAERNLNKKGGK